MKKFTLVAAFAAMALGASAQYVTKAGSVQSFDFNANTDYIPFSVSDAVKSGLEERGIRADWGVDDVHTALWIWSNTYVGGTPSGMNSLGLQEGYIALVVNEGQTWSGAGFATPEKVTIDGVEVDMPGKDVTIIDDSYSLHFAVKSTDKASHIFGLGECKFTAGETAMEDNGVTIPVLEDFPRDGAWYAYDIPLSVLKKFQVGSVQWKDDPKNYYGNLFWFLSGPVAGTQINLDQIFLYRSNEAHEAGINNVAAAKESNVLYNLAGQKVDANFKGIVVKNGKKFMNK